MSIHQFQGRPEEAGAEDPGDSSDREDGEEELGQVNRSRSWKWSPWGLKEEGLGLLGLREEG